MKFRKDFVTNSSSSSFVCYGVGKDDIKLSKELYIKIFNNYVKESKGKSWFELTDSEIENMTEENKIEFVEDELDTEELYTDDIISVGGYDNDEVGIEPTTFIRKFPDEKIGDIKKIAAREINKKFGTNFTENDISYFESGWYDG